MYKIKLFRQFCIMNYKSLMEYKADFLIGIFPVILNQIIGLVLLQIVFNNIHTLSGKSFFECVMIYGFYSLSSSIEKLFFGNFPRLKGYVFGGQFDLILLKPAHPLLYMTLMDFNGIHIAQTIIAGMIVGYSFVHLNIVFCIRNILFIIISVVYGVLLLGAMTIFTTSIFFYTEGTFSLFNIIELFKEYAKYPISIFGKGALLMFPMGMISYFPTELLLAGNGKSIILYMILGGIVSIIIYILSNKFFDYSAKKYQSTGG